MATLKMDQSECRILGHVTKMDQSEGGDLDDPKKMNQSERRNQSTRFKT